MVDRACAINHELLSSALSHLGEGVMITDNKLERPGPLILYVNEAMCRISGYTSEEILNNSPRMFQGEDTDRSKLLMLKSELALGHSCTVELVNYRKNGEKFDVELFLSPMFNAHGECTNYVSVVRDLTVQKQLRKELIGRQHQLNAILNTAVDAIVTIDQRGIIVSANRATTQMFGYTIEELLGSSVSILMPEPFRREHDRYIHNYLETGQAKIIGIGRELSGQRKDGRIFPMDLAVAEVDDAGLFTGVIRDLTSRRELQQEVLEIASAQQKKIGFVLHEGIGQDLTALNLMASTLANCISAISDVPALQSGSRVLTELDLGQLQRLSSRLVHGSVEAIKNLNELALGVMPVPQDSKGLNIALQHLCTYFTAEAGPQCRFQCQTTLQVEDNNVATHIYHIIKEALTSLSSNADVSRLDVDMRCENDELVFEVSSDCKSTGISCPTAISESGKSNAISAIMQYRAGIIGASLAQSRSKQGSRTMLIRLHIATLGN